MILKTNLEAEYDLISFDADRYQISLACQTGKKISEIAKDFEDASSFDVFYPSRFGTEHHDDAIESFYGFNHIITITDQNDYYLVILERGEA